MFALILFIIALVGFISADQFSIGCYSAVLGLSLDKDVAACLNPGQFIPALGGVISGSSSGLSLMETYISGICSVTPCSQDVVSRVTTSLTQSCGDPSNPAVGDAIATMAKFYPATQKVLCLKNQGNPCTTQILRKFSTAASGPNLAQDQTNILDFAQSFALSTDNITASCIAQVTDIFISDPALQLTLIPPITPSSSPAGTSTVSGSPEVTARDIQLENLRSRISPRFLEAGRGIRLRKDRRHWWS